MSNIRIQPVIEVNSGGSISYKTGTSDPLADYHAGLRPTHWEVWDDNQSPPKMLVRSDNHRKAWNVAAKAAG